MRQKNRSFQCHGNIGNIYSVGTNNLIKNGAYLTTNYKDIINFYPEFKNRKKRKNINSNIIKSEFKKIYNLLGEEFITCDKISQISGENIRDVVNKLTLMEMDGIVESDFCKGYKKIIF